MKQTEQVGNVKITLDGDTITMVNANTNDTYRETWDTVTQAGEAFNEIINAARKVIKK